MSLDRQTMIDMCLDGFFLALNAKDLNRLTRTFTDDCQMLIPSSELVYKDAHDLMVHLTDFTECFAQIDFHDFIVVPDPETRRAAATFTVTLTGHDGAITEMRNANFFDFAEDHRIARVLIIATQPLDHGFQAGRS